MEPKLNIEELPIIDISMLGTEEGKKIIAEEIHYACKQHGFFYIKGHGIEKELTDELESVAKKFYSLPLETKMKWKMGLTNREWLGFFKVGQEITYNNVDWKEGWYIDSEKDEDIKPDIGASLFPTAEQEVEFNFVGFKDTIQTYLKRVSGLAQDIMEAVSLSLLLPKDFFYKKYTFDPFTQMAMLHYPSFHNERTSHQPDESTKEKFGTGPHTDQGFLTILYQDTVGGLQVQLKDKPGHYIEAPPVPGTFICNIGDMLDKLTNGYYLSNVHRVRYNTTGRDRYSFAFFFDPNLESTPEPIPSELIKYGEKPERWDKQDIHEGFSGTYGDYFMTKIGRIFPDYVYKKSGKLV